MAKGLRTRNKWTDQELFDSYTYYRKYAFERGGQPEAKSFNSKLAKGQMTEDWIDNRILKIVESQNLSPAEMRRLFNDIQENYEPILFEIKDIGNPPTITLLDETASRLGGAEELLKLI